MDAPQDIRGAEIKVGVEVAYPTGGGSHGAQLVVGRVVGIEKGKDRWERPVPMVVVETVARSDHGQLGKVTRIWMTRKAVVL